MIAPLRSTGLVNCPDDAPMRKKTEILCLEALKASAPPNPPRPEPGENVIVARWIHPRGVAGVLILRRHRHGHHVGDVDLATRNNTSDWDFAQIYAGSLDYHDFFTDPVPAREAWTLGYGEYALTLDGDDDDAPTMVAYLELAVGTGITRVVSEGPDGRREHEISPVGGVLVGVLGAGPASVTIYVGDETIRREEFVISDGLS
jgi:hypothetical protein